MQTIDSQYDSWRTTPDARRSTVNPEQVEGLDINLVDDGYIIFDPLRDKIHFLNPTAAFILELCDGNTPQELIVAMVQHAFQLPELPTDDVREALEQLRAEGLLV